MKNDEMVKKMESLVKELNEASKQYYNGSSVMSDHEWDQKYDELLLLESMLGVVMDDSPTKNVGYQTVSALEKVEHHTPALSLDKTKDRESLSSWLKNKKGVLSWKLDGLTVVATYEKGKLVKAVTRGNGYVGEDVTHNAKYFKFLPATIPDTRTMEVRGEAVISYKDFERVNAACPDGDEYENPRNLASGTVRLLSAKESAPRGIHFVAFTLVNALELGISSYHCALDYLGSMGFYPVPYEEVDTNSVVKAVDSFEEKLSASENPFPFPTDGLVLVYDDIAYGESLGRTAKYPRNGIAFKWQDETANTVLREIEWSASRTGRINPVAIFDPVFLEGTTVSRATIHNVSIIRKFELGLGDEISVYKANMIIPAIADNMTRSNTVSIPHICPVCGKKVKILTGNNGSKFLYCANPECPAKEIGRYEHFCERDCFNIRGLSGATLEKIIDLGLIHSFRDIFHLKEHRDKLIMMAGFGEKSADKLLETIEECRNITFRAFFASLGIPDAGRDVAGILDKGFVEKFCFPWTKTELLEAYADGYDSFLVFEGIGEVKAIKIAEWFSNEANRSEYENLLKEITITDNALKREKTDLCLTGKKFVITGSLERYSNRKEMTTVIEMNGGKVSGSVSSKTDFLINNDSRSNSSKNKKAKELGIPIITEQEFYEMLNK